MPAPAATPPPPTSDRPATDRGYLAATLGGVLGGVLCTALGVAVGMGLAQLYSDPNAGLEGLWVLVFPIGLGALGIVVGEALGVWRTLRRDGHRGAGATAWCTVPASVASLFALPLAGLGVLLLVAVPAASRWLVLAAMPRDTA